MLDSLFPNLLEGGVSEVGLPLNRDLGRLHALSCTVHRFATIEKERDEGREDALRAGLHAGVSLR
jgi:hypothetical protein